MKTLLMSPAKMSLPANEMSIYQNVLKQITSISLNLLAVKVSNRPEDFCGWCEELMDVCCHRINLDLMEPEQFKPLKKVVDLLACGISVSRLRSACVAPWPFYIDALNQQATVQALEERCRLLEFIETINSTSLCDLSHEDRMAFIGKHTAQHDPQVYNFDVQWFGSTKSAKTFIAAIENDSRGLDKALSYIPLTGEVTLSDYQQFVACYQSVFANINAKAPLYPATRLLAMRRPDQFVVLTSANAALYSQGLGGTISGTNDFSGYWQTIIVNLRQMHWWRSSEPELAQEQQLWKYRAILLDVLLHAEQGTAEKSNYLKLLNKPKKASKTSTTKRVKRSKESAQELVDRVLASDDINDVVRAQRDSIVSQVQAGKSIDEVINLINKIFG